MTIYIIKVFDAEGRWRMTAPVEADYDAKAKNIAGHILRGMCAQWGRYDMVVRVYSGNTPIGEATCIHNGARERGPNVIRIGGILQTRTPEEKAVRRAAKPLVNKVVWR